MSIAKPTLPGTVIRFTGQTSPRIPPSAAATVAIPLVSDWGPLGADPPGVDGLAGGPQVLTSFADYTALYGDSDTAGRTAVAGAFAGQGLPGFPGAGGVLAWRMAGAGAAKATHTINSTAAGTAPELRLDAKYTGSRGNRFTYTVDSNPSNLAQDRLRLYLDGVLQETYLYTTPNLAALVALINARSNLVVATALLADGAAGIGRLTAASVPVAFAGGADGAAPVGADHLAALAGIQFKQFGVIAPYDLTDSAIQASYLSWVQAENVQSRPVRLVLGGAAGESIDVAVGRAQALNDEHVITIGGGTYHDDLLAKDLSTSQLAPRIAGILAAKGEEHSITFAKIGGLHAVVGVAEDEVQVGRDGGVVVLAPTDSADADLRIEEGVTTYSVQNDPTKPYDVFSDSRLVGVMDNYVRNMKVWGDETVVGELPVNEDTRSLVRGYARQLEDDLLRRGLILPGDDITIPIPWVVVQDPGDPALEDTIPYTFGWRFAKTANNVIGEGSVS